MKFHSLNNIEANTLRNIFDFVALSIGNKLTKNPSADERGLTDDVFAHLSHIFDHIKNINGSLSLQAEFKKPSEKKTGADILVRIIFKSKAFCFDRFVLIQAKKYFASENNYKDIKSNTEHFKDQIAKMSMHAEYYNYIMLFNPQNNPVGNLVEAPIASHFFTNLRYTPLYKEFYDETILRGNAISIAGSEAIAIFPSRNYEYCNNNNAETFLNMADNFAYFMVDDFIKGKIGHDWNEDIEKIRDSFSYTFTLTITRE